MPVLGPKQSGKVLRPAQPDGPAFDIDQQGRAIEGMNGRQLPDSAIGDHHNTLYLCRVLASSFAQPAARLIDCIEQRRASACTQTCQPGLQCLRGFQPLMLPTGGATAGGQQRQACALPVGVIEQLRQQPFGLA